MCGHPAWGVGRPRGGEAAGAEPLSLDNGLGGPGEPLAALRFLGPESYLEITFCYYFL